MFFRTIIKLFEQGNVCVTGLKGRGKDMLMSNVVVRRKLPYVSNVNYDGRRSKRKIKRSLYRPFNPLDYDIKNTYDDFIKGTVKPYSFPHSDGTDIYISDSGVYFPCQYNNDLNKKYGGFVSFLALSRHLGNSSVHCNAQNLNRIWDKLRETSDTFITCNRCIVFLGFVFQIVTIYENYDSCVKRVPPFRMKRPFFNPNRIQQYEIAKTNFITANGIINRGILFYRNKSKYDTRVFKSMMTEGEILKNQLHDELRDELRGDLVDQVLSELRSGDYFVSKTEASDEKKN